MATTTMKVLGQAAPAGTTETALYTVPAATRAVVSSLTVCERGGADATFRVSVSVGGGATATKDYLCYDSKVYANDLYTLTLGITLGPGDVVRVYASSANLSFNLFGSEIT